MSFYASMTDSSFYVPTQHTGLVLAKLQKQPHKIVLDGEGNITSIDISGYLTGNENAVLQSIAPYVKDDSYIKMRGADGSYWSWLFSNGFCKQFQAKLVWEG